MKKILFILFVFCGLVSCDIENDNNQEEETVEFTLEGNTYELISYMIQNPVDLNDDDVFSNDLLTEGADCFVNELFFDVDNQFWGPNRRTIALSVEGGVQDFYCVQPDGGQLTYLHQEDEIVVSYNEQIYFSGVLSNDNTTLTFVMPFQYLHGFGFFGENDYLNENGEVLEYTGNATAVYQLVE